MKDKFELINRIIEHKQYSSYLELGLGEARETFDRINCFYRKGVDNNPRTRPDFLGTTDDFFKQNTRTFDVIYIDAFHEYSQVNKDFENAVKVLNPDGIIFMHDVGPENLDNTKQTASGTAYISFIEIRGNPNFNAFSYIFPSNDVLGIVKVEPNKNILVYDRKDFDYYFNNKSIILQGKSIDDILALA